jgi:hypothetical protein
MKTRREQLKTELMGKLEQAVERVLDWQEAHPSFTLTELEDFVLGLRREVGEGVAAMLLGQLGSKAIAEGVRCEGCGGRMRYKGQEGKYVTTRVGEIEIERGRYWCPECHKGIFPPG